MSRSMNSNQIDPPSRKQLRRFYEPLLLLFALDPIRGERKKAASFPDEVEPNNGTLRRFFADDLAYIAAYNRGPNYVTATALEKTPQGITVWLAANSEVEPKVTTFLERVLFTLQQVAEIGNLSERSQDSNLALASLHGDIIVFNTPKLQSYYELIVNKYISPCVDIIQNLRLQYEEDKNDAFAFDLKELGTWLHNCFVGNNLALLQASEFSRIIHTCYHARQSQLFHTLRILAGQGKPRNFEFEQLYKLLGKLGKVVVVSKRLVYAAEIFPNDFVDGFIVKTIPSSRMKNIPLPTKETAVMNIVGRMFSEPQKQKEFLDRLQFLQMVDGLSKAVKEERKRKTRVHAELLLINHFDQYPCNFLDPEDKYIGCSKPACYLCYIYIINHSYNYAHPASHQKVYLTWRLPDILEGEPEMDRRLTDQKRILLEMIKMVRRELTTEIESRTERRPYHADSTAGLTSTVQSQIQDADGPIQSFVSFTNAERADSQLNTVFEASDRDESQLSDEYDNDNDDEGGVRL